MTTPEEQPSDEPEGDEPLDEQEVDERGGGGPGAGESASSVRRYRPSAQQWLLAGIIAAVGIGFTLYHGLKDVGWGQTAALYLGIPLVIAVVLTLSAPAKTATGTAMKVTTVLLLASVPILGEGVCCVLFAAPLFYLFVYLGVIAVTRMRKPKEERGIAAIALPMVLVVMALEGTSGWLTVPGSATASETRTIDLPVSQVASALGRPLTFGTPTGVLAVGFPRPHADTGGLSVGAVRTIMFDGAHHRPVGMVAHHWGEQMSALVLRVTQRTPTSVHFTPDSDNTPLSTWLRWDGIDVSWRAVDATHSEVTWRLNYTRLLSPAWYFGPVERVVTGRAADYLIGSIDLGPRVGTVHS